MVKLFFIRLRFYIFAPFQFVKHVKTLDKYSIDIFGLSFKRHEYEFEVGTPFFQAFGSDLIQNGKLAVKVALDKSETMITSHFTIKGTVELVCDRSLELFDYPVTLSQKMIYKFGEEDEDISDEICIIAQDTNRISIVQPIYDYVALALPMKRIHPKYSEEDSDSDEADAILIYTSGGEENVEEEENIDGENLIDPRWAGLEKLKNQQN